MGNIIVPTLVGYSVGTIWFDRITTILWLLVTTLVLCYHIYTEKMDNSNKRQTVKGNKDHVVYVRVSVFSVIVSALLGNLLWLLVVWNPGTHCEAIWIAALAMYCINRVAQYEFAVIRLKVVFDGSPALEYKNKFITFLAVGSFLDVFVNFWLSWWSLNIGQVSIEQERECFQTIYLVPLLLVGVIDNAWMVSLYWLFYTKMSRLFAMVQRLNNGAYDDDEDTTHLKQIAYITRKLTVLLAASIISTWSLVFFLGFSSVSLSALSFDMSFNCICLTLCDKRYDRIYLFFCKCVAHKHELMVHNQGNIASKTKGTSAAGGDHEKSGGGSSNGSSNMLPPQTMTTETRASQNMTVTPDESKKYGDHSTHAAVQVSMELTATTIKEPSQQQGGATPLSGTSNV